MSKLNLEKIISDIQALKPFEFASEIAKIISERAELKAENDVLKAENQDLRKSNQELKNEFAELKKDHDAVADENHIHRLKYLKFREITRKLTDALRKSQNENFEELKARIATLENENKDLNEKFNIIYKKNEKLAFENEIRSSQIQTYRSIEQLILENLDQKKLNETSEKPKSQNTKPKECEPINIKQENVAMPNIPTSTSSTQSQRKKALVTKTSSMGHEP